MGKIIVTVTAVDLGAATGTHPLPPLLSILISPRPQLLCLSGLSGVMTQTLVPEWSKLLIVISFSG